MLLRVPYRSAPWWILLASLSLVLGGCEDKTQDNINTPATRAKRSRELEQQLAQKKQGDRKTGNPSTPDFNSLRAERDRKRKEAELRQEKLQIAKLSFTAENPPEGFSVQGLSSPESWGSWSIGDKVTLHFDKPLPNQFKLQILARAYGPNANKPITLGLGKQTASMKFKHNNTIQSLDVELKSQVDTITFMVPKPTSPAEMNESSDERKLGIGLVKILILRATL